MRIVHSARQKIAAEVLRSGSNITPTTNAAHFTWYKRANSSAAWAQITSGTKEISLVQAEMDAGYQYKCSYAGVAEGFGSIQVDNTTMATHTPGTADANDEFEIVNGNLTVTTSRAASANYTLENGIVKITTNATETISATASFSARSTSKVVSFKYDHNGLRTQKKVIENGVTTTYDYTLHGKLITHLTKRVGTVVEDELHFFYDSQTRPAFVEYGGVKYRYVHNLQGDIVAIVDVAGNPVVEYKYDAWGKPIYEAGNLLSTLGNLNPFRYRGYIWDGETNQYYLGERFYYPEAARIINPDGQFDKSAGIQGFNLFSYCTNNPIAFSDKDGRSIVLACTIGFGLIGAIAGGIIAGSAAKNSEIESISDNWGWYALGGALLGGALGALVGWGIGKIAGAVISLVSTKGPELYESWRAAEEALRKTYNTAKTVTDRTLTTETGKRVYDAFNVVKRYAYEAKYGYQSYSGNIIQQIVKDTELLQSGAVKSIEWHFYRSVVSNTQGLSKALENALDAAGILIVKHY